MNKEKKFLNPEAIIVNFTNDDIITGSGNDLNSGAPMPTLPEWPNGFDE